MPGWEVIAPSGRARTRQRRLGILSERDPEARCGALVRVRAWWEPRWGRWLLAQCHRTSGELAFYVCFGPQRTSLAGLARVAGAR